MCKGLNKEESRSGSGVCRSLCTTPYVSVRCELCGRDASVFCEADTAFLCRKCDRWVHEANFLAWRHVRRVLCTACQKLTRRSIVGEEFQIVIPAATVEKNKTTRSDQEDSSNHKVPFVFL